MRLISHKFTYFGLPYLKRLYYKIIFLLFFLFYYFCYKIPKSDEHQANNTYILLQNHDPKCLITSSSQVRITRSNESETSSLILWYMPLNETLSGTSDHVTVLIIFSLNIYSSNDIENVVLRIINPQWLFERRVILIECIRKIRLCFGCGFQIHGQILHCAIRATSKYIMYCGLREKHILH